MKTTNEQIKIINDMIEEAIEQGAEYGCTCYCYIDNLMVSLNRFVEILKIENVKIIESNYPYLEMTKGE